MLYFENRGLFWKFLANLKIFDHFENFSPFWNFLTIFGHFEKFWKFLAISKIFDHFENFWPFWKFLTPLKFFGHFQNICPFWKFLTIFQIFEHFKIFDHFENLSKNSDANWQICFPGEGTDITVSALDRTWNLHIIYLKQSEYFNTYFGGRWATPSAGNVHLEIPDERIDTLALDTVFGSLYCDEINIAPDRAVNVRNTSV